MDTPWERMQRANRTAACWACCSWAWVGGPPEAGEAGALDELEPQAAIMIAATVAAEWREVVLDMTEVVTPGRSHQCNIRTDGGRRVGTLPVMLL